MTTLGLLIDSDPKNNSLWTTIFEYVAMLILTFIVILLLYGIPNFVFKQLRRKML
jgi:competence protein ComGC